MEGFHRAGHILAINQQMCGLRIHDQLFFHASVIWIEHNREKNQAKMCNLF